MEEVTRERCAFCNTPDSAKTPLKYELYNRAKSCRSCFVEKVNGCRICYEMFPAEMTTPDVGQRTHVCDGCLPKIKRRKNA